MVILWVRIGICVRFRISVCVRVKVKDRISVMDRVRIGLGLSNNSIELNNLRGTIQTMKINARVSLRIIVRFRVNESK
jgi:hypothetical protein